MVRARPDLISVVLCTTGDRGTLTNCLTSLRALEDPSHEVIVVENCPTPRLNADELAAWGARLVHEPSRGLNVARNRGVVESSGAIVAFVDDDCVVDRDWLSGFRRAFEDPAVGFVTGRTQPRSLARRAERSFEWLFSFDRGDEPLSFDRHTQSPWSEIAPGEVGSGCNMAFRRAVLDSVGVFDEALDMGTTIGGGGDLDMFGRLLRRGTSARYVPDARARHQHRRTMPELAWQVWGYGVAQGALACKVWWRSPPFRRRALSFWKYRAGDATRRIVVTVGRRHPPPAYLSLLELAGLVVGVVAYPVAVRQRRKRRSPSGDQWRRGTVNALDP